jgi:hypothetical protein
MNPLASFLLALCSSGFIPLLFLYFATAGLLGPTFFGFLSRSRSWLCTFICFRVAVLFSHT